MSKSEQLTSGVSLYCGDCLNVLGTLPENSIDAIVTDPPYHLTSIVKRFSKTNQEDATQTSDRTRRRADGYARLAGGFMGKQWDGGDIAFRVEIWEAVLRVLKPGGHLLSFGGSRTYHRMACAIEGAGFDIRDQIQWVYGSGFPKSLDLGKATNREEWKGFGTALKPSCEPIVLARKPLSEGTVAANVLKWGTGAINIDACRVETRENLNGGAYALDGCRAPMAGDERHGAALGMFQPGKTAEKEFEQPKGRWPANVIHDGSPEVVRLFPETSSGVLKAGTIRNCENKIYGKDLSKAGNPATFHDTGGDSGSAARFFASFPQRDQQRLFYSSKADAADRSGSRHPTVKPLDLIQYLARLVTPPHGHILDPFAGSGTTGEAAVREGFRATLIEREPEYQDDIRRRMRLAMCGPDERAREIVKARGLAVDDAGPLFGGSE